MKNNKLVMIMAILLVVITLVGVIAVVLVLKFTGEDKPPTIDEVIEASVDVPELTTNLADGGFIKISFKIETDNKKAKEELEKRDFQVKNIIISELSEREADELRGKKGQANLEETLKVKFNEIMQEGKIQRVYITGSLLP